MTRLVWDAPGERLFETGVDRGVLYVGDLPGVPWNGLISVSESPSGGEISEYYIDGVKYLIQSSGEEFEATIEAFTYPDEFAHCDGTLNLVNGLSVTNQKKNPFGLVYRTRVGNDVEGIDFAYKLHFIFNAMVSPTSRTNTSLGDAVDPDNFSWKIVTKPESVAGYRDSAHWVVDSRATPAELMTQLEDIVYGTTITAPRQPSVSELLFIFGALGEAVIDGGVPDEYVALLDGGAP